MKFFPISHPKKWKKIMQTGENKKKSIFLLFFPSLLSPKGRIIDKFK